MRSLLLGTCIVLALWGLAVTAYLVSGKRDDVGILAVGTVVIIQLQMVWVELGRGKLQRGQAEGVVARAWSHSE